MARKGNKRSVKKTYSVIVDGQTEIWYLQMLKKNEKSLQVNIKPELPQNKKLREQYESVTELSKKYDQVIWIIDADTFLKENREVRNADKATLQELQKYKNDIDKNYKNVTLLVNTPCLEFWFLLHFKNSGKFYEKCGNVGTALKSYLKDYKKTEKYFKKQENDIYSRLKDKCNTAFANAKELGRFDFKNTDKGIAEMYKLFEIFRII